MKKFFFSAALLFAANFNMLADNASVSAEAESDAYAYADDVVTTTTTTTTSEGKTVTTTTVTSDSEKPKFKIAPRGRLLFDGAVYTPDGDGFAAGVAMPDVRLGVKMSYGKWSALVEAGYAFGKVGLKDIYLQYTLDDENLFRLGYFVHQFGLNAPTSASMKPSMVLPTSDAFFNATGRNLGLQYILNHKQLFVGVSAVAASNSMTNFANEIGKTSLAALNRTVWRPFGKTGEIVQIGASFGYQAALHKKIENEEGRPVASTGYFDFSANFPTEVDRVSLIEADVQDAKGVFKLSPEWLFTKGRISLEGQYYYMNVARKGHSAYQAQGMYALLRGILVGKDYGYSYADAYLTTPGPKSLELVLGYNYTNANCRESGVFGGITNDYSATFNYYINKYIIARLRYSYTNVTGSPVQFDRHVNTIQARIQIIF